jgi:hypothetical protein
MELVERQSSRLVAAGALSLCLTLVLALGGCAASTTASDQSDVGCLHSHVDPPQHMGFEAAVGLCRRYKGGGFFAMTGEPLPLALPDDPDLQEQARRAGEPYTVR